MIRNDFEQPPERTHDINHHSSPLLIRHHVEGATSRQKAGDPLHHIEEAPAQEQEKTRTPVQTANDLRQLSREVRALREGVRSLLDGGGFGTASTLQNLRLTQMAFEDAVVLFEHLANLLESD